MSLLPNIMFNNLSLLVILKNTWIKSLLFILGIIAVISAPLLLVNADSDKFGSNFRKLNETNVKSDNIEDYDIAHYFKFDQSGQASWYGKRFHNRKTASGEIYNMNELTAAHKTVPFGTILRVTNDENNISVLIRINDRGPFVKNRVIDLSFAAATEIDGVGIPDVKIEGMIPDEFLDILNNDDTYFFGYSFDRPLICIPSSVVRIFESTSSFNEALNLYSLYMAENPGKLVYLFTRTVKYNSNIFKTQDLYFVGMFDPTMEITPKDLVQK